MDKREVTIAELEDRVVKYRQIDDCYVCPYDTGDKFAEHNCSLSGEFLHVSGRVDVDVPETCPFPARGRGVDGITLAVVDRYPGISEHNLSEIVRHINKI